MPEFMRVEDLIVYQRLCALHLEVCACTRSWPPDERFELTAQIRRASNSSPANLAERHSDRHIRNKIEGVNRARGEALETIHHLYIARLKGYVSEEAYDRFRDRYVECVRMLNGLERTLEAQLPESERRWNTPSNDAAESRSEPGRQPIRRNPRAPRAGSRTLNPEP